MDRKLRVYVTDGKNIWKIYTIFINAKDGSFYYAIPSRNRFLAGKFSYHPSGTTHFKTSEGEAKYRKYGWSNFRELTICDIDSFGFEVEGFLADDLCFQELKQEKIKEPALVFEIGNVTNAFMLRLYLGKREILENRAELIAKVKPAPPGNADTPDEKLMDVQIYNFGVVKTDLGPFDLSCAVALIQMSK